MASTKDILSAQRFNRARLMTAFQSGMPGGRELTPARPWGALIGGVVLTILLFGAAWVSTLFTPSLPAGWDHGSLITDENTGARYVSVEGTLHPIRNASSAHLLFPGNLTIVSAGSEALSESDIGAEVGIPGAPDQVPTPSAVADPVLLTCTGTAPWTGVNTGDWESPDDRGVHVTADGEHYLVAGGYRYRLGDDRHSPEAVLTALGLPADHARPANATWLAVFPEGEPLASLTVPGLGEPAGDIPGIAGEAAIGTVLEVSDTANAGNLYLLHGEGRIERLTPVMFQLYAIGDGGIYANPLPITSRDLAQLELVDAPLRATWPEEIRGLLDEEETPCAHLDSDSRQGSADLVVGTDIPDVSARTVDVAAQSGAVLRTRTDANLGYTHLIDESGTMYTLAEASSTLTALGLEEADELIVPAQWRDLFDAGPILSSTEAWSTVPEGTP